MREISDAKTYPYLWDIFPFGSFIAIAISIVHITDDTTAQRRDIVRSIVRNAVVVTSRHLAAVYGRILLGNISGRVKLFYAYYVEYVCARKHEL